jgi:hypothetical protein
MPEPPLDGPGVVAFIGEGVAAGVPKHVGMGLELHAGCIGRPLDHAAKPAVVNGDPRSLTKTNGDVSLSR